LFHPLPLAGVLALTAQGPVRAVETLPLPGPPRRPSQLQLRYPAHCHETTGGSDNAGRVLRRAFDALGEWQCGWQTPDPRWRDWNLTLWGGAMTDGNMGESLQLDKGFRSEVLGGLGVQGTIWNQRRLGLIVDANLIGHRGIEGGTTPRQTFSEGTIGLGLRFYPNRWLSFTVVEGMSGYSERSELALRRGGNGRRLVNYLAFELDAAINDQLSLVGRLHHRSGIYGTINCVRACDNNGYLLGLRYHFARPKTTPASTSLDEPSQGDPPGPAQPQPKSNPAADPQAEDPPTEDPPTEDGGPGSGIGVQPGGVHRHLLITETPLLHTPAEQHHQGAGNGHEGQGEGVPLRGGLPSN
jgi:hypothetical protein